MTVLNIGAYGNFGTFVVREANGYRSREQVVLAAVSGPPGVVVELPDGAVLGRVSAGASTAGALTAATWNDGNPTASGGDAPAADANIDPGVYTIDMVDATHFVVRRPDGVEDGSGVFGTAYDGSINFKITAGVTPCVAGDRFTVTVTRAAGTGSYVAYDPTATNGAQVASAILLGKYVVSDGAKDAAVIVRDCEVQWAMLGFTAGMSSPDQNTARSQLAAGGIVFR